MDSLCAIPSGFFLAPSVSWRFGRTCRVAVEAQWSGARSGGQRLQPRMVFIAPEGAPTAFSCSARRAVLWERLQPRQFYSSRLKALPPYFLAVREG